jgi:hypothetical protein
VVGSAGRASSIVLPLAATAPSPIAPANINAPSCLPMTPVPSNLPQPRVDRALVVSAPRVTVEASRSNYKRYARRRPLNRWRNQTRTEQQRGTSGPAWEEICSQSSIRRLRWPVEVRLLNTMWFCVAND